MDGDGFYRVLFVYGVRGLLGHLALITAVQEVDPSDQIGGTSVLLDPPGSPTKQ